MKTAWFGHCDSGSAVVGGVVWMAAGLAGAEGSTAPWHSAAPLLTMLALLLLLPGLAALFHRWRVRHSVLSPIAALVAGCGMGAALSDLGAAMLRGAIRDTMLSPVGGLGVLMICGGLVLLGSAALSGDRVPGWQGTLVLVGLLGLFLPLGAGVTGMIGTVVWVMWGLGWTWLGAIMLIEAGRIQTARGPHPASATTAASRSSYRQEEQQRG